MRKLIMALKVLAFIFLCQLLALSKGDVEIRIEDLAEQMKELREEVSELSKTIDHLETSVVKRNIADQKLDKAIANVLLNKQEKATMYWGEVVSNVDSSLLNGYLKTLIENTYLGNSDNFYYVLDFLITNGLYMGFPMLYKELEQHRELQSGQEIFALAHQVKHLCGMNNELYKKIPKVIRDVLAGPVILKNVDNNGYLIAAENNYACSERSASACYQDKKDQIFIEYLRSTVDQLKNNSRAHWQFMGPDNVTDLSLGFYIKNMDKDFYFIFNQRPATAYFNGNTSFDSYWAGDIFAQFLPALIPNASPDDDLIRIGVRERIFRKIDYLYGAEFKKKVDRLSLGRRPIYQGDVKGFVWQVTPTNGDNIDNTIDGGEINEKCNFTT